MRRLTGFLIMLTGVIAGGSRVSLCGQQQEGMIKYTPDFRFTDGIYIDFNQVKNNSPVPKTKILTSVDYNSDDFFEKLMAGEKIYYFDGSGLKKEVERDMIWGYASNGIIHMQILGNFNTFTFMGKICHIIAEITYNDSIYFDPVTRSYIYPYSPYRNYIIYGDPYTYIDPYSRRYYDRRNRNMPENMKDPSSELDQYLIDFETGDVWEYDVQGVKALIKGDTELYEEYRKLRNRMKRRMMFSYIRRYNERNPLFISSHP